MKLVCLTNEKDRNRLKTLLLMARYKNTAWTEKQGRLVQQKLGRMKWSG